MCIANLPIALALKMFVLFSLWTLGMVAVFIAIFIFSCACIGVGVWCSWHIHLCDNNYNTLNCLCGTYLWMVKLYIYVYIVVMYYIQYVALHTRTKTFTPEWLKLSMVLPHSLDVEYRMYSSYHTFQYISPQVRFLTTSPISHPSIAWG